MADSTTNVSGFDSFVSGVPGYTQAIQGAIDSAFQVYNQWKALQAHPKADEWVAGVQNPFGASLSIIVDSKDAAVRNGTATADDVYFAQQSVIRIWDGYRVTATQFAGLGPTYATVINQSYETLQPLITSILGKMDNEINALGGISLAARVGVNVSHFRMLIWVIILFLVALLVYRRG
jgi:hypothetical protein